MKVSTTQAGEKASSAFPIAEACAGWISSSENVETGRWPTEELGEGREAAEVYGMNFVRMPELAWTYGYAYAIGLMVVVGSLLAMLFRRRGWL